MNLCIMIILACIAGIIIRISYVLLKIFNGRKHKIERDLKKPMKSVRTMIIAGSGGHTSEILRLLGGVSSNYKPRYYIMADSDKMSEEKIQTFEINNRRDENFKVYRIPRSREVKQSWTTSIITTLYSSLYCFPLVFRVCPDIILCNGPGTCIPLCAAAFFMTVTGWRKVTIVYIESICRVESLSLSGRILYYFADQIVVQWPQLQLKYPLTKYLGKIV